MSLSNYFGPKPTPKWKKYLAQSKIMPLTASISGEISVSKVGIPLGVTVEPCQIVGVHLALLSCGKDDTSVPAVEVDVKINGATCLTTKPKIAHVSGEAAAQKTTVVAAADTGITQAVINYAANTTTAGGSITYDLLYTGNASPTTKAHGFALIVEVQPLTPA